MQDIIKYILDKDKQNLNKVYKPVVETYKQLIPADFRMIVKSLTNPSPVTENNFTKEITHHSADVGKNIYEVRFYLDESKKHTFLHCYHDEDGWRDFDYFVGGLLAFVKESEENKEKATEMFRHFDCVESE